MESKNKNTVAKIIIIIAIALIIVGILIAVFKNHNNKEETYYATFMVDGVKYQSDIIIENGYISRLPDPPKKEGYVFDYWEINGQEYTGLEKITDDVTLTAVFKEVEEDQVAVITFNKDNGEDNSTIEIVKNEKVTPISEPEKEGHKFLGWYLNDEQFSFDTLIQEDITLTAKWEILSSTVKFDSKGGNKVSSQEIEYGNQVEAPKNPTRDGYKFLGWYLNNKKYNFSNKVTKDITLIAKWEKEEEEKVSTLHGDVNGDGNFDNLDLEKLIKYLQEGEELAEQAMKNADVNVDGKVDNVDKKLIIRHLAGWYKDLLPDKPITDYVFYGDLNEDGEFTELDGAVITKYLVGEVTLSEQALKNADVNVDGKVDGVDEKLIMRHLAGWHDNTLPDKPITNYVLYGDLNEDGIVDLMDLQRLLKYLVGETTLSEQALKNADINDDEKIDDVDRVLILRYLGDLEGYKGVLPDKPITNYAIYGDLNHDFIVNLVDATLLQSYLTNADTLDEQALKNADVNVDGKVNDVDRVLIDRYLSKWEGYTDVLPENPITNYVIYGDVDDNGIYDPKDSLKLLMYLANQDTLSEQGLKNADVNTDGKVNKVDSVLILRQQAGWYSDLLPNKPITDYVMYGDVNTDGIVDSNDIVILAAYLNNEITLSTQRKKNADVNADGEINTTDHDLLLKYLESAHEEGAIPDYPLS